MSLNHHTPDRNRNRNRITHHAANSPQGEGKEPLPPPTIALMLLLGAIAAVTFYLTLVVALSL